MDIEVAAKALLIVGALLIHAATVFHILLHSFRVEDRLNHFIDAIEESVVKRDEEG